MNAWRNALVGSFALAAVAPGTVAAQGKCEVNTGSPYQVSSALIYLNKAAGGGKADESRKHMKSAVGVLTQNPEKINNQAGRNYVLGKSLVWWATQGGAPAVAKRGDLGYATDPNGMIDVGAAIDSAFSAVDAAKPECMRETADLRKQIWTPAINAAGKFMNEDKLDSAEVAIKRAQSAWSGSALPTYYMAVIAQKRNNLPAAALAYKRTVDQLTPEAVARDSSMLKIRQTSLYNYALITQNEADAMSGDAKTAKMKEAAAAFRTYVDTYPGGERVTEARTGLARALGGAGDTAAVAGVYAAMVQDPSKYTDIQLFEAGTSAFRANRRDDAAKLLEAGLAQNPYFRDALFNLANTYFASEQFDKMLPVAQKLVSVDPNNPDNWRLVAGAFQGMSRKAGAALKKAQTDSVIKYVERSQKTAVRMSFTGFQHAGANHTLTGSAENTTDAAGNYVIKFEFLDKTGNVVASREAAVSVPPKSKKEFRVEVSQAGVVAFRYAPIS
ncbi:MAG: tetratricopeptide repeat protein [Gemmatimonadaceae bacterium]